MAIAEQKTEPTMAEQADRHHLYQESVQNPEFELDFIDDTFKAIRGRKPTSMREDFAGTAISSCEFVKRRKAIPPLRSILIRRYWSGAELTMLQS